MYLNSIEKADDFPDVSVVRKNGEDSVTESLLLRYIQKRHTGNTERSKQSMQAETLKYVRNQMFALCVCSGKIKG